MARMSDPKKDAENDLPGMDTQTELPEGSWPPERPGPDIDFQLTNWAPDSSVGETHLVMLGGAVPTLLVQWSGTPELITMRTHLSGISANEQAPASLLELLTLMKDTLSNEAFTQAWAAHLVERATAAGSGEVREGFVDPGAQRYRNRVSGTIVELRGQYMSDGNYMDAWWASPVEESDTKFIITGQQLMVDYEAVVDPRGDGSGDNLDGSLGPNSSLDWDPRHSEDR